MPKKFFEIISEDEYDDDGKWSWEILAFFVLLFIVVAWLER